ncbi:MAG TPA: Nramp family divalent metal transporter [Bryobacteraceae bacterium]|nr:Nramp family divalent metal transporter [Bryobacteraceae bacterium]
MAASEHPMSAPATPTTKRHGLRDLYEFHAEEVTNPPRSFLAILKRIGPGMILAASIVGSGELIATTTLGAEVGYVALWVIGLSCFIKPAVQAELGRYVIATGETGLESFNALPGPSLLRVKWVVWAWACMVVMTFFQIGAMFGGTAQTLNQIVPSVPINAWVVVLLGITLALLLRGGYHRIEKLATLKVALFTMLTFLCALILIRLPQFFSWGELAEGLTFRMPPHGLASAVAVFGITGVGATEMFMYPYWCVEKGYARFAGRRDGSEAWRQRALGWMHVMHVDIVASMIIYCIATIAFYLLGAGILNKQGLLPAAKDMIPVLSNMYTQTLGPWALYLFYAGAIATLYGTIFAATAAHSRVFADMARLLGAFDRGDYRARLRYRDGFIWFLTVTPVVLYFVFQSPVNMVKIGGVAQALMLPVIAAGALYLRHKRLPAEVRPGTLVTGGLWFAAIVIISLMLYYAALSL